MVVNSVPPKKKKIPAPQTGQALVSALPFKLKNKSEVNLLPQQPGLQAEQKNLGSYYCLPPYAEGRV